MSEETREERWAREKREYGAKVLRAWKKYGSRKDGKRETTSDEGYTITFDEGTKETKDYRTSSEVVFRFRKGQKEPSYVHKHSTKNQKFLVVSGPLKGQRITDENEEYQLFNAASFNRGWTKRNTTPRCVMVYIPEMEAAWKP